jgi:predicted TIM-barrel fold metal-dependent hydrolase
MNSTMNIGKRGISRSATMLMATILLFVSQTIAQADEQPIIDIHAHGSFPGGDAEQEMAAELAEMDAAGISLRVVGLTTPENVTIWSAGPRDRLLISVMMVCPKNTSAPWYLCFPDSGGMPDLKWLREQLENGTVRAFHELLFNFDGSLPGDPKMDPYWALAAEFDVPVGVHTNSGPPPGMSARSHPGCCPNFNAASGNPKHLRAVLEKYPTLRIWLQHVGTDMNFEDEVWQQTMSLMQDFDNVYADLSILNSVFPLEQYEATLNRLIKAGFGDRIMFGSDGMSSKAVFERLGSLDSISQKQKRAILFDNAARFLRLEKQFQAE